MGCDTVADLVFCGIVEELSAFRESQWHLVTFKNNWTLNQPLWKPQILQQHICFVSCSVCVCIALVLAGGVTASILWFCVNSIFLFKFLCVPCSYLLQEIKKCGSGISSSSIMLVINVLKMDRWFMWYAHTVSLCFFSEEGKVREVILWIKHKSSAVLLLSNVTVVLDKSNNTNCVPAL